MGIFDRRREPDAEPEPTPAPRPQAQAQPQPQPQAQPQQAAAPRQATAASTVKGGFGIQRAMELMRNLPADNVELVVEVVRKTLESANIDVANIITDANDKQETIEKRVAKLRAEIAEFREEIAGREQEIRGLEADFAETKSVKERLLLAMKPKPKIMQQAAPAQRAAPPAAGGQVPLRDPVPKPPSFE
jgi:2-oxoglutarate dehydrogenase E2 component (dihydrolipoamide succinyltransferase)